MISRRYHRLIQVLIIRLRRHAKQIWYTPLISLLAFLDNFLIVIPNDGILISSSIFLTRYGLLFVFVIGLSPIMQHPAIVLAALANTPLINLGIVIFAGRLLKFLLLARVASHAPKYISRFRE